jgi:acylphosphatase
VKKAFRAIVTGRVLGVDFRSRIQRKATSLGLTGFVRALPNCSLEVVAQGSEDKLKDLAKYLEVGPRGATVEKVTVDWDHPGTDEWRFTIRAGE